MSFLSRIKYSVVVISVLFAQILWAQNSEFVFPQGKVRLVSSGTELGLHFQMQEHWHIYWKNSGDSGAAPKWSWKLTGAELRGEKWPVPERIPIETLINFGYSHETLFIFPFQRAADTVQAELDLEFLICKVECIPYFTKLSLTVPAESAISPLFSKFQYPEAAPAGAEWKISAAGPDILSTRLQLPPEVSASLKNLEVFPFDGESFKAASPDLDIQQDGVYNLKLQLQDTERTDFSGSRFLVVAEDNSGARRAFELELASEKQSFAVILLWALIGGLILNIMPCVFPVLSIKILSFLGPDKNARSLRISGWFYTLGVMVSFALLGGLLLFLRAGGEQIGWGFQLQSPVVAGGIAVLFFWLGLNFLGVFEIGQSLSYLGAKKTGSNAWGSFFTGVLATVVATPCTAPFMGAALGASLALPAIYTMVVFLGLGFGMALPFLVLAYFPQGLKFLPKPGMWMQRLKEFLAFPLLATVLWLLWVISNQVQSDAVLFLLGVFVLSAFWIWLAKIIRNEKVTQLLLLAGFLLSLAALSLMPQAPTSSSGAAPGAERWQSYTAEAVQNNIQSGQAVFIDFTAAWCITCQVNKKLVLNTAEIQQLFTHQNVVLYKADWTDRDPKITEALASYGRNSLPLYVYYAAGSDKAVLLPEILTQQMIRELFNKL